MNRCITCAHWTPGEQNPQLGTCGALNLMICPADDGVGIKYVSVSPVQQLGPEPSFPPFQDTILNTRAEFGCISHKTK